MSHVMHVTHKGLMYNLVPIWVDMTDPDCPGVAPRFFGCDVALTIADFIWARVCELKTMVDPDFEPMFVIKISEELDEEDRFTITYPE